MASPTLTLDIRQLLQDAFGIVGFRTLPTIPKQLDQNIKVAGDVPDIPEDIMTRTSVLGTPILMPVSFDQVKWTELEEGEKKHKSLEAFDFPPATLIDFTQAKVIERTKIKGRNGTVKEYIGMDDWMIRLRGVAVNEDHPEVPPHEFIKQLNKLKNVPAAIPILNDLCRYLGIKNVVIENIDFPSLEGYANSQSFVLECSSDEIFELKYKEDL